MPRLDQAAQLLRHGLLAVTDTEHGNAGPVDRRRGKRRILVEQARHKKRRRHGGDFQRQPLEGNEPAIAAGVDEVDLLTLSEALDRLEAASPRRAQLVKLRYFAGFTLPEVAELLGISQSTAEADWTYTKAWLVREMEKP